MRILQQAVFVGRFGNFLKLSEKGQQNSTLIFGREVKYEKMQ
jgi:hypothetical protein